MDTDSGKPGNVENLGEHFSETVRHGCDDFVSATRNSCAPIHFPFGDIFKAALKEAILVFAGMAEKHVVQIHPTQREVLTSNNPGPQVRSLRISASS